MIFHPGLKLWSINTNLLPQALEIIDDNLFHYIELTPIPNSNIEPFFSHNIPFIIHATTERHDVNLGDKKRYKYNLKIINECLEWADELKSKYIIIHPGFGDIKNTLDFLENIDDKRIVIENMPKVGINREKMIGSNPEEIKQIMETNSFGFCFDINHGIKAAISNKLDYKQHLKEYLKLKPSMFHISDGSIKIEIDEHLHLGDGDYDLQWIKKNLFNNKPEYLTFETPRQEQDLSEDIKNLEFFKLI